MTLCSSMTFTMYFFLLTGFFSLIVHGLPSLNECITPPMICPNTNITFWLYTRETQQNPHELSVRNEETIRNAIFAPEGIKFLIHGYLGHKDYDPNIDSRPAYFQVSDTNVISIDYGPLVKEPCYFQAVRNVPLVSKCAAQFLDALAQIRGIDLSNIHVVAMSLGAHVAGSLSNWVKSGPIGRITGLDPALPLFTTPDLKRKLDRSDAKFVDVIHTDVLRRGKLESMGHLDHYVNGGVDQKGCEQFKNLTMSECSHWRAPLYFAESITAPRDKSFYGKICSSWFLYRLGFCPASAREVLMGEYASKPNVNTMAFVETNSSPPFARGPREKRLP